MKLVSMKLGNTAAICRKSYVHPLVISIYLDGSLMAFIKTAIKSSTNDSPTVESTNYSVNFGLLSEMETVILDFLQQNSSDNTFQN